MKPPLWTSLAMIGGLVLMVAGPLAVSYLLPTAALWTDADAQQLGQASAKFHAASHAHTPHDHSQAHSHSTAAAHPQADWEAARREFDQLQARLNRSQSRRSWLWYGASILGALLAAAGIAGHFLAGRSA